MNTATVSGTIVALDLGKYKSVVCIYDSDTTKAGFATITTSRSELLRLVKRYRPAGVVIEACALAGWVHDLCAEHGGVSLVANYGQAGRSAASTEGRASRGGKEPAADAARWIRGLRRRTAVRPAGKKPGPGNPVRAVIPARVGVAKVDPSNRLSYFTLVPVVQQVATEGRCQQLRNGRSGADTAGW